MSKWAYIPLPNYNVLGKTIISEENINYQDRFIYSKFLGSTYGYIEGPNTWAYVNYGLQVNFVKLLDTSIPEAKAIRSTGIYEGAILRKKSSNQLNVSKGVAFFPQGRKKIIAQDITLQSGNTEPILYIFKAFDGSFQATKDMLDTNVYVFLGAVTMDGDTILNVYDNVGAYMPGSIKRYSDFFRSLGPWISGATYTFNSTNGSFSRIGGFINNFYPDKIRVTRNLKIEVTKVYKGDVLGQTFTNFTLADLKEYSTQGGGAPITSGQIVTHYIGLDPSTLKTYLFVSDYVRSGADTSINIQSIISDVNRASKGKLFSDCCVLIGAIAVRFSAVNLGNLIFIRLHSGISGARGIGTGVYPSPLDFPKGGDLVARNNNYTIEINYHRAIEELRTSSDNGKYVIAYNENAPNNIEAREYGNTPKWSIICMCFARVSDSTSIPDIVSCNKDRNQVMRLYTQNGYGGTSGQNYTGFRADSTGDTVRFIWGGLYDGNFGMTFPRLPFLFVSNGTYAPGGRDVQKKVVKDKFMILQVLNNVQPSEYADFLSKWDARPVFPFKDNIIMAAKQKAQELRDKLRNFETMETWSTIPMIAIGETGAVRFIYTGIYRSTVNADSIPLFFGIQPNDVLFVEDLDMNLARAKHFFVHVFYGDVFKPLSTDPNNPYKNKYYTTRIIQVPYANIPYTGAPT